MRHWRGKFRVRNLDNERIKIQSLNSTNTESIDTVVVVDVYRAFTTAVVALENGATGIIIVDDIAEALALRAAGKGSICIGERNGVMPDGFDFGNSPADIASAQLDGVTLIQTTTNGTRGIKAVSSVPKIYM